MKKWWIIITLTALTGLNVKAQNEDPHSISLRGDYIYNLGFVEVSTMTNDFTDAELAHYVVSAGQMCGVNPETGVIITNAVNLLPVMFRSAYIAGEMNAGTLIGNAAGLTEVPAAEIVGVLPASALPTNGVWNARDLMIQNAEIAGSMNVESDLNVGGDISGNASGLTGIPAGGTEGSIQVNAAGQLEGNTNYFIHAQTEKLAFGAQEGNVFRVFSGNEALEEKLIYALRRKGHTVELVMRNRDADTIRLSGSGDAMISGTLVVGGLIVAGGDTAPSYIPESGDLSMGAFTQP